MTEHLYAVGQQVRFDGQLGTYLKQVGAFTVTKLLPPLGSELQYRIKAEHETHERVALEHELYLVKAAPLMSAAPRR